jgi:undecaprenyl diphosphate synthase
MFSDVESTQAHTIPDIDPQKLPVHVAIIMDGNGRWAKQRALNRIRGHEEGAESVREIVRTSREIGISWLTLYAFSEENWRRPRHEISALMSLLKRFLKRELNEMLDNGIKFQTIGRIHKLPAGIRQTIQETIAATSKNEDMVLTLALSYGGRQELADAIQGIAKRVASGDIGPADIDERLISEALYTSAMPDPDLLIRTSGECRVSNFLLWQVAYTEIHISPTLWPDFRKVDYLRALENYQRRERRFGATEDQLTV